MKPDIYTPGKPYCNAIKTQKRLNRQYGAIVVSPCTYFGKKRLFQRFNPLERTLIHILDGLFKPLVRIELETTSWNDPGSIIYAFNHNRSYEVIPTALLLLKQSNGRRVSFLVDWMYGRIPILGRLMKFVDPVYVYNKPSRHRSIEKHREKIRIHNSYQHCIERLKEDYALGIFPEGTRNKHPERLKRGRKGIGRIVLESRTCVRAVGIDFPLRNRCGKIPMFGSLTFRVGPLLSFHPEIASYWSIKHNRTLPESERKKVLHYLTAKVTYDVMITISDLSGKTYDYPPPLSTAHSVTE
jgi:1-acyl-sn-glycerol-3-phosphate acyltransferase